MPEEVATHASARADEAHSPVPVGNLGLPRSGILLENGVLVRRSKDGTVIATHPLSEISDLRLVRSLSLATLLSGVGVGVLSIIAKVAIASSTWSWIVGSAAALLATILILGSWGQNLRIELGDDVATYNLYDQDEDCRGFVLSLTSAWKKAE